MRSTFYHCKSILPQAEPCTPDAFNHIVDDNVVKSNCDAIALIASKLPDKPTDEQWAAFKKAIAPYKCGDRSHGISSLPGFCFHAAFPGGKRNNNDAQLSGLVSIDLDHLPYPREYFATFSDDAIDQDLLLAYVSPSSRGLKLVFRTPEEAHTLSEAQQIIVRRLHLEPYADDATTDAARLSFAAPRSYILYYDEDELFADEPLPIGFTTKADIYEAKQIDASKESHAPLPQNIAAQKTYKGIPYKDIIDRLAVKLCGTTTPAEGQRHTMLLKALRYLRTICDDNYELLLQVMPQWDPDTAKFRAAIKYVLSKPQYDRNYQVMEDVVAELKAEQALQNGHQQSLWTMPKLPRVLPPLFREYMKVTPKELQPAVLFSLLPMVGVYGSMLKVNVAPKFANPKYVTPSFIGCILAPPASGKSSISRLHDRIMKKLMDQDDINIKILNEWQQSRNKEGYKGKEPMVPVYNLPERLSMTSISTQIKNAAGRHIMIFTPEIDTLKASNGSGSWNDLSTVIRKSTDNDKIGQIYRSTESISCYEPTYLNILMEAQPLTMRKFFNTANVYNGLVDRVNFVELPDTTGMEEVFMRRMSEKDWQKVKAILDRLFAIGNIMKPEVRDDKGIIVVPAKVERVEARLPRTLRALNKWTEYHRDHYMQAQVNPSEDHFMRRARETGIKAALLAYATSGMRETTAVVKFAEYIAEFDMRMHVYLFGKIWNEQQQAGQKVKAECEQFSSTTTKAKLFDLLPHEFTVASIEEKEHELGITDSNPRVKVGRWMKRKLVEATGKDNSCHTIYRKLRDTLSA